MRVRTALAEINLEQYKLARDQGVCRADAKYDPEDSYFAPECATVPINFDDCELVVVLESDCADEGPHEGMHPDNGVPVPSAYFDPENGTIEVRR